MPGPSTRLIGLTSATALVVANMIGTGIFATTGFLLADLPSRPIVLLAWLVGGLIALLGAICYGALARVLPESGGEYFFLSRTIHPAAGYVGGWISLLVGFSAPIAAAGFALGEYTQSWAGGLHPKWIGTVALTLFALVHAFHLRTGLRLQDLVVALKILLIVAFIGAGASQLQATPIPVEAPSAGVTAFLASLVWIYFAYSGWNAAVYIGGEVSDPEKTLPRALLIGTVIVIILYLALNVVFVYGAPYEALAGQPQVAQIVARSIGGDTFANFTTALIAVALLTSISAMMMTGPRVYAKMAEDGYLPRWFHSQHPPATNAVLFQWSIALFMLWIPQFRSLLTYIGFTLGLGTALTVAGLMRLRMRDPRSLHVPGWPWIPILFLIAITGVTVASILRQPFESLFGFLTIAAGLLLWRLQRRSEPHA